MDPIKVFEEIKKRLGEEAFKDFKEKLTERLTYPAVIVFMGKTGVGKSSTCNALFGQTLFKVDDVNACTRDVQFQDIKLVRGKLTLVDVPGVGEALDRRAEYTQLYDKLLKEGVKDGNGNSQLIDVVVWLTKADDRALQIDQAFFKEIFKPAFSKNLDRLVIAINQADKIAPIRGPGSWDDVRHYPGPEQLKNLDRKRLQLSKIFGVSQSSIIDYSAEEAYNLDKLLDKIVMSLPPEKTPIVVVKAGENNLDNVSKETAKTAGDSIKQTIIDILGWHQVGEFVGNSFDFISEKVDDVIDFIARLLFG